MGLTIAGLGVLLLLDQTGLLGWHPRWSIWPFLLIAFGLARYASPRSDGSRNGLWLVVIGVWLLLFGLGCFWIRRKPLWVVPLPLIAAAFWLGGMNAGAAWLGWTA